MIHVRLVDFPYAAHGVTLPDKDGNYEIYINARLSPEQQREALLHELGHVSGGDNYKDMPGSEIEALHRCAGSLADAESEEIEFCGYMPLPAEEEGFTK